MSVQSGVDVYERAGGGSWKDLKSKVQCYAQQVYKSVGAYLSKYVSKQYDAHSDECKKYYPSRWWGCSRRLLKAMRTATQVTTLEFVNLRQAKTLFEEIKGMLQAMGEACFSYKNKVGFGKGVVAYGASPPSIDELTVDLDIWSATAIMKDVVITEQSWTNYARISLHWFAKELRKKPYSFAVFIDSLSRFEREYLRSLEEGKLPMKTLDVDLLLLLRSVKEFTQCPLCPYNMKEKHYEQANHLINTWYLLRGVESGLPSSQPVQLPDLDVPTGARDVCRESYQQPDLF